ncbi:MAG: tripartite tricarboxylate transporter substrate-binding protein, partial [Bordetella sp.]|nr:tripartite tricarboxylate transporter substrate-binding protein [Bordetella sp.]
LRPGVPSVADAGVNGFQVIAWNGVYVPRGTPGAVVKTLNDTLATILKQPEVRKRLLELGHEPAGGSADELRQFAASERKKWGPLIAEAGLKAD